MSALVLSLLAAGVSLRSSCLCGLLGQSVWHVGFPGSHRASCLFEGLAHKQGSRDLLSTTVCFVSATGTVSQNVN